jgi:hypothetical protein
MGQPIRPSQFILSYGVGSIIEAPKGPRLVPIFEKWDLSRTFFSGSGSAVSKFRIEDRNARAQLNGGEIFEIPTNPQFDLTTNQPLFRTFRFPKWALCQQHRVLYQLDQHGRSRCPNCRGKLRDSQDEAIRFVRACPNGHLDDVDWRGTIHGGKSCHGDLFDWVEETGSDLKSVRIRCRTCRAEVSLRDVYFRTYSCSGYFPEEGRSEPCDEKASVVLRSATSLRIPEVITSLTIPRPALRIHLLLSQPAIGKGLLSLAASGADPKNDLIRNLKIIASSMPDQIDPATISEIEKLPSEEVKDAIADLLAPSENQKTPEQVKDEEFTALQDAAEHGYPLKPSTGPLFEVDKGAVIRLSHSSGVVFRITPVKRLRVVLVQRGYRRPVRGPTYPDGHPIRLVDTAYTRQGVRWYPGVAMQGEGIFIDLPDDNPTLSKRAGLWEDREKEETAISESAMLNPLFVWWHTLAHRIIYGLSIDSGYSSAAIRERIYFRKKSAGNSSGGILLYTSQQGSDGSLGGLMALCTMKDFSRVLRAAERNLSSCSNDPLCSEHLERNNGAACYACLLVSETSCEFHNTYLDRLLLSESLPRRGIK